MTDESNIADQDGAELDLKTAEARLRELTATVEAGAAANVERAGLMRLLREHDQRRYTQARLAELAGTSQQAVSVALDPKRSKWHLRIGSHELTITGPTLKEAVTSHRIEVGRALSHAGYPVAYDGGNIIDVASEVNPQTVTYYNIEAEVEIKRGGRSEMVPVRAASGTRRAEMNAISLKQRALLDVNRTD